MTLATSTTLGSPGIDRFSPAQLLRTARLFASDPELPSLVDHQPGERRWFELDSSPYLQIWLLSWPVGTDTGAVSPAGLRATGTERAGVNW